jgi:ribulose kinase
MSQHVTYRLPDTVVEDLRYLSFLTQTTPARVIATWISVIAQAIDAHAGTTVPGRPDAAELLRNGGTMLTLAEQQAVQQLHQMIGHWGQAGSPPPDRKTP